MSSTSVSLRASAVQTESMRAVQETETTTTSYSPPLDRLPTARPTLEARQVASSALSRHVQVEDVTKAVVELPVGR